MENTLKDQDTEPSQEMTSESYPSKQARSNKEAGISYINEEQIFERIGSRGKDSK